MRRFLSFSLSLLLSLSRAHALFMHTHDLPDRAPAKVPSFVLGQQFWKVVQAAHFPWITAHLGLAHPSESHPSNCQVQLRCTARTRGVAPERVCRSLTAIVQSA